MGSIFGLGSLNTSAGVEKLVALKGRHFWVYNSGTGAWDIQAKPHGRYLTNNIKTYHVEFLDNQFWVNGTDANRTYDGSTWSITRNVENSPRGKYPLLFGPRIYLANINFTVGSTTLTFPSRVAYSDGVEQDTDGNYRIKWGFESGVDLTTVAGSVVVNSVGSTPAQFKTMGIEPGDPFYIISGTNAKKYSVSSVDSETQITLTEAVVASGTGQSYWVSNNFGEIKTSDSDILMGITENSDKILAFKKNSLYRCTEKFLSVVKVKGVPGTTSFDSVVNLRDFTFYFHPTGIWRYNGVTAELISEPIWDIIEGIASSAYDDVVAWTDGARFVKFFVGDITASPKTNLPAISKCVLIYDITMDNWSLSSYEKTFVNSAPWVESSVPKIYAGASDGNVYQLETGNNFDTVAIPFRLIDQPRYPISKEVTVKGERIEEFSERGQKLEVKYRRYNQPHSIDSDPTPVQKAFPQGRTDFRGIQIEVDESSVDPSFLFEGVTVFNTGGKFDK